MGEKVPDPSERAGEVPGSALEAQAQDAATTTTPVHDMHCHLDFMSDGEQLATDAAAAGSMIFANTVELSGYVPALARFGDFDNVRVGLGLHPWWVGESVDRQLSEFDEHADETRFIGEVGLDFGKRGKATYEQQLRAFEHIARSASRAGGRVLSIHAIRSADSVLRILRESGAIDNCTCIFHWFSGSVEQLHDAIGAGCLFSVNPMMANSKRGREYLKVIPVDRLLLETDAPPGENVPYSFAELSDGLREALHAICQIKGPDAASTIDSTAKKVLLGS